MLYRYEMNDNRFDHPHYGIFMALNDVFDRDEALRLTAIFEDELRAPPLWYYDSKQDPIDKVFCCFTQKGNRKFSKAIKNMKQALEKEGYKVNRITFNEKDIDILYEDEYQAVIDARYIFESSTTIRKE